MTVQSIGKTAEGRDQLMAIITAPENFKNLKRYQDISRRLSLAEGLTDEVKERIEGLTATHDFLKAFGHNVPDERKAEMREQYPVAEHPVVVTHEATGQRLLYVNRIFTEAIVGLDPEESADLLWHLCRQAETVEYQVRFRWQPHSVVFWDNRAVQHYASSDYWPERRVMERASIVGGRPSA